MQNGAMRRVSSALFASVLAVLFLAAPAAAKLPVLKPASYPGMTTFNCRTDAITLQPGQNLNRYELTKTTELLREMEVPIPELPAYDPVKDEPFPWEADVQVAIEKLRKEKKEEGTMKPKTG